MSAAPEPAPAPEPRPHLFARRRVAERGKLLALRQMITRGRRELAGILAEAKKHGYRLSPEASKVLLPRKPFDPHAPPGRVLVRDDGTGYDERSDLFRCEGCGAWRRPPGYELGRYRLENVGRLPKDSRKRRKILAARGKEERPCVEIRALLTLPEAKDLDALQRRVLIRSKRELVRAIILRAMYNLTQQSQ